MHIYVGHVKWDPERGTGIAAAICGAADPPITVRPGKAHSTAMRIFAPISKPAAPACAPQLQSRRERGPGCRLIFGCLAVTRTDRASQLAAAKGEIQPCRGHKRTGRRSRAGKPQRQPGQAQPQHTQASNTNKQQHDTNKGESSHTSLIPSSFRVKRLGSAQREQHDRIQAS